MSTPERVKKGERTRERLFEAAVGRLRAEGYAGASMRAIAADAGVTPALSYRYFASKEAIVAELYERRLAAWEERAAALPAGTWAARTAWLTRLALEVLAEDRELLRALLPAMAAGDETASPLRNPGSVRASRQLFGRAVAEATNKPRKARVEVVAELGYLAHLALLLFWVMDQSEGQRATEALLKHGERLAPLVGIGLDTPLLGKSVAALVHAASEGLGRERAA